MANYWLLSAGKDGELWPVFWTRHRIAIGWSALEDLGEHQNYPSLRDAVARVYPNKTTRAQAYCAASLWKFYKEMSQGDLVFIRSYTSLLGIALVEGPYGFLNDTDPQRKEFYSAYFDDSFPHVRDVRWVSLGGGMKQPATLNRLTVMPRPFREETTPANRPDEAEPE